MNFWAKNRLRSWRGSGMKENRGKSLGKPMDELEEKLFGNTLE